MEGNKTVVPRKDAERQYQAALKAARTAEDTYCDLKDAASEQAWEAANANLNLARQALLAAEEAFPTARESKRVANILRLRNRGLEC